MLINLIETMREGDTQRRGVDIDSPTGPGMVKPVLKKSPLLRVNAREIEQVEKLGAATRVIGAAGVSESVRINGGRLF